MTTIIVQALPAYSPTPGMIGVVMGSKPIERFEVPTLNAAIESVTNLNQALTAKKISHYISTLCYGRKPNGWNKQRLNRVRSWCPS